MGLLLLTYLLGQSVDMQQPSADLCELYRRVGYKAGKAQGVKDKASWGAGGGISTGYVNEPHWLFGGLLECWRMGYQDGWKAGSK